MNLRRALWWRIQQWLGAFTIWLLEESSETGLFRHLSDHAFGVRNFKNAKFMRVKFLLKCLKFNLDFKNAAKNSEKIFPFWYNCIWIGIVKLSLWRTRYFSSTANVLRGSRKILYVNIRNFLQLNFLGRNRWIW